MAYLSMNLFLSLLTLFLISNIVDAAVNCATQNQLLWTQPLSVDAGNQEFGTVALSSDSSTVFATVYYYSEDGPSYLVGTATNGSGHALMYSTQSSNIVYSSPVFVNSSTIAWATLYGGSHSDGSLVLTNIETNTSAVLYSFSASGYYPYAITFDSNNNTIYGVTYYGGASNGGVIFSYNLRNAQYQTLYNFTSYVYAYAIVYANNALYVTLDEGGSNGVGSIGFYNLSTSSFTELHGFSQSGDSGYYPFGAVAISSSGDVVYGTTYEGGSNDYGTLFSLNVASASTEFTILYSFTANAGYPEGGLVLDETNGLLYGTAYSPNGGVFAYDLKTNETTFLYLFTSAGGNKPYSGVALSADKTTLYGITGGSGSNSDGPAAFYALSSCYTAPVTTTAAPTTAPPTTTIHAPTTTTAPPTTTTAKPTATTAKPTTTTAKPTTTTAKPTTTTHAPTTTTSSPSVKSNPKTGSIHRFDSSPSLMVSLILSLAVFVLFH